MCPKGIQSPFGYWPLAFQRRNFEGCNKRSALHRTIIFRQDFGSATRYRNNKVGILAERNRSEVLLPKNRLRSGEWA